jgi:hypothetical protein
MRSRSRWPYWAPRKQAVPHQVVEAVTVQLAGNKLPHQRQGELFLPHLLQLGRQLRVKLRHQGGYLGILPHDARCPDLVAAAEDLLACMAKGGMANVVQQSGNQGDGAVGAQLWVAAGQLVNSRRVTCSTPTEWVKRDPSAPWKVKKAVSNWRDAT